MKQGWVRVFLLVFAAILGMAAPAFAQETVVVSKRVIYPGETVSAALLDEVPLRRHLNNPAAYAVALEQLAGKVARQTLLPGRLIPVNAVREAYLVEPGSPVAIVFEYGAMVISTTGMPLQAGVAGEMIRLRNMDSGTVITGMVMEDGSVKVPAS